MWRHITATLAHVVSPRRAALLGLAAVAVVLGCSVASLATYPGYSLLRNYVSELAAPKNPGAWVFTLGLLAGGALLTVFSQGLRHVVPGRHGEPAAWLGSLGGIAMMLVGCFPLTQPTPHFGFAFVLFTAAIFATLFMGLGLREPAQSSEASRARRRGGTTLLCLFVFMLAMTTLGGLHTALAFRHVSSTAPDAVLKELPRFQMVHPGHGLPSFNPVAMMEWVFLIVAMGLVLAASIALLKKRRTGG